MRIFLFPGSESLVFSEWLEFLLAKKVTQVKVSDTTMPSHIICWLPKSYKKKTSDTSATRLVDHIPFARVMQYF
jgi:hypothetical protein